MKRSSKACSFGVLLLACWGYAFAGPTIINGSFEEGGFASRITLPAGSTVISGWVVLPAEIDWVDMLYEPSDGMLMIDLNGGGAELGVDPSGGIVQQLSGLKAGRWYRVLFDMAGNVDGGEKIKNLKVVVGLRLPGTVDPQSNFRFNTEGLSRTDMGWRKKHIDFFFPGGGQPILEFRSLESGNFGPFIDNVRIRRIWNP